MRAKLFNTPAFLGLMSTTTFGLVQFLVIALYPALSEATDIQIAQLILSFTVGSVFFIWSAPFWAKKSDQHGRQKILSIGLSGLTLSFAFLIVLTNFEFESTLAFALLTLSRMIYGLTASAIVSVVQAWWRDQSGDVTKNMISHSMGLNLGRFLAPLLVLLAGGKLSVLLQVVLIWTLLLTVASFLVSSHRPQHLLADERKNFEVSFPVVIAFLSTLFVGVVHSNLAHEIQTGLNLSAQATSVLCSKVLLMSSLAVLIFQFAFKKLSSLSGLPLIWTGVASWIASTFFLYGLNQEYQLWFGLLFISLGLAVIAPGYLSLLKSGGKAAGQMSSTQTLGLTLGGFLGYFILQGYLSFYVALFSVCALLLALCLRFPTTKEVAC